MHEATCERLREATKVKTMVVKTMQSAEGLSHRVQSGSTEYEWMDTPKSIQRLNIMMDEFKKGLTDFQRDFLAHDAATLNKMYDAAEIARQIPIFLSLKEKSSRIAAFYDMLMQQHLLSLKNRSHG